MDVHTPVIIMKEDSVAAVMMDTHSHRMEGTVLVRLP